MRTRILVAFGVIAALAFSAAAEVPVVVAVDTSRSLRAGELESTTAVLADAIAGLPASTPTGLVAFDDQPHWVVRPGGTPTEVAEALRELKPAGAYTLLHDALFVATRELTEGGVVLLATDGRDENSATTVEDVARLAQTNGVRIVTVSTGRSIDERALRRLALLTDGSYRGRIGSLRPPELRQAVTDARGEIATTASERAAAQPTPAPAAATPEPEQPTAAAEPERGQLPVPTWMWVVAILAIIAIAAALIGARRQPAQTEPYAPWRDEGDEGDESAPEQPSAGARKEKEYDTNQILAMAQENATPTADRPDEVLLDPSVFEKEPLEERLEKTFVLKEQHLLVVKEPKRPSRTYYLHDDKTFAVGRAHEVNTLTLADPALSAQHFKIVPKDGRFFVVDLDTTNGTQVNGRKVRAAALAPGDTLRAGHTEFEFRVQLQG